MDAKQDMAALDEKHVKDGSPYSDPMDQEHVATGQNVLHRDLKGRHMQMIAMYVVSPVSHTVHLHHLHRLTRRSGGAIGAGLFVSSGSAFQTGGPGSVLLGFMIVGEFDCAIIAI